MVERPLKKNLQFLIAQCVVPVRLLGLRSRVCSQKQTACAVCVSYACGCWDCAVKGMSIICQEW